MPIIQKLTVKNECKNKQQYNPAFVFRSQHLKTDKNEKKTTKKRQRRRRHGKRESFRAMLWTSASHCYCPISSDGYFSCVAEPDSEKGAVYQRQNAFVGLIFLSSPKSSMYLEIDENPVAERPFPESRSVSWHYVQSPNMCCKTV